MKRRIMAIVAMGMAALLLVACSASTAHNSASTTTHSSTAASEENQTTEENTQATGQTFTVGICQLAPHPALDAATGIYG